MRRRSLRCALAAAIILTGCNAILGTKDTYLDPSGPGGPGGGADGSTTGDGDTTSEGSTSDSGSEGGTCNADLTMDPKNCGRCGHDCVGGACANGFCAPVVLAMGLGRPDGIALGPNELYVTTFGGETVLSIPKSGGTPVQLAAGEKKARGVAVAGNTLYWANGDFEFSDAGYKGGIWQCALPTCTGKQLLAPGDFAANPVIRGNALYFDSMNTGEVRRVAVAGGPTSVIATSNHPFGLAVDDSYAYYTSFQPTVYRALIDGGSKNNEQSIGPSGDTIGFIALDDQRAYWAYTETDGTGHVVSMAKALGALTSYGSAADNVFPVGVVVDDDYLYWSTDGTLTGGFPNGDGKVLACPKQGCDAAGPFVLATGLLLGGPMAVDEKAVYWVEFGGSADSSGRVRKVAKP